MLLLHHLVKAFPMLTECIRTDDGQGVYQTFLK